MQNKKTLLIFPFITQFIFSLIVFIMGAMSLEAFGWVFLLASVPAFLIALPCVKFNYHRYQLLPIGFWSGVIAYFYSFTFILVALYPNKPHISYSLWEDTILAFLYAFSYALPAIIYGMIVLRPFLRKRSI